MAKTVTVNSVSGGKTSAYITVHYPADYEVFSLVCIDDPKCAPKDRSLIQYVNAKLEKFIPEFGEFIATAEDDRTMVAMRDLEQFIGREITWVRGHSFDDIIDKPVSIHGGLPTRLPSWARRYCTDNMKLYAIFLWWYRWIGEKINMRIGFRFDEFDRMLRFFNNSDPCNYAIPISQKVHGTRRQSHQTFNWRFVDMPLVRDGVIKKQVVDYWQTKGYVGGSLFEPLRKIEFPEISNCVGCFHKKPNTLAVEWNINENKMEWFSAQEQKGKGNWLDSGITYDQIKQHALATPYIEEMIRDAAACDSGGCTD